MTFLVGHRGVGKSTFLRRLQKYFDKQGVSCLCLDLDEEISRAVGLKIEDIFEHHGEAFFRRKEIETFESLMDLYKSHKGPCFVALGAGFQGSFPDGSQILWVRRETDALGRVFMDRPKLEKTLSHYEDYQSRFEKREFYYSQICDEQITILEGYETESHFEEVFLGLGNEEIGGGIVLQEKDLRKFSGGEGFLARRLQWGIEYFEIRDDLLEDVLIKYVLGLVPKNRLVLSFRRKTKSILESLQNEGMAIDWPLEKGPCPYPNVSICSLHKRNQSLQDTLLRFEDMAPLDCHLKLAVEIHTLQELLEAHSWWRENPQQRSFLPVSNNGRWRWYRTLFSPQMKVAFFREGQSFYKDQPFLAEWIRSQKHKHFSSFAAVIGEPISHSLSPFEQESFFNTYRMPFVSIPLEDRGDFAFHIEVLRQMGMVAAAVTSPHKENAYKICSQAQNSAVELKSVNTILFQPKLNEWLGANTDLDGIQALRDLYPEIGEGDGAVIWGGGGTKEALQKIFSLAVHYSARNGLPTGAGDEVENPRNLFWAVGRNRQKDCLWPPDSWKPQWVFDLNYSMDSPGREYAHRCGARYVDGKTIFQVQARSQQRFWIENGL